MPVINGSASLESDCLGHLWIYDVFNARVYEVESRERGWCVADIPWLSGDPVSGTVPGTGAGSIPSGASSTLPVAVTFDLAGLFPGLDLRTLLVTTDTPDPVGPLPLE